MQISERAASLKPSSTLAVSAKAKALKAQGVDVIGFGAGEPDFDTPEHIRNVAVEAIHSGWTRYVASAGDPATREAVAEKMTRENGLDVAAENVIITPGDKHALFLAMFCLLEPGRGDEVLLPVPAWVSYRPIAELCGGRVVEIPATLDSDFKVTPAQIAAALTANSRLLILNSPNNPCGTVYTPEELREIAEVINRHNNDGGDVLIISDEIYEKLIYGETEFCSIGRFVKGENILTVNGLGKCFAMTGWRIGYAAGPVPLINTMARLQSQMNTSLTGCCYPTAVYALKNGEPDVARMRATYEKRAQLMFDLVHEISGFRAPRPTGAFYVFPDVSRTFGKATPGGMKIDSSLTFADALLDEARVAVVPGDDFGGCGANHVRLSFACSEEDIQKGLTRVREFVEALQD